jgi:hypothetical protein
LKLINNYDDAIKKITMMAMITMISIVVPHPELRVSRKPSPLDRETSPIKKTKTIIPIR